MRFVRSFVASALPLSLICAGFVASAVWITAGGADAAPAVSITDRDAAANDQLEQSMRQINSSVKALTRGITADNRDESLAQIVRIEQAVISAKTATPDSASAIDAAKQPAFFAEFRKSLVEVLKVACDVEIAILDGKYEAATELVRSQFNAMKKRGHEKFKDD